MTNSSTSQRSLDSGPPTPPASPVALNGWGRYISAEMAAVRRDLDRQERRSDSHETRIRGLEQAPKSASQLSAWMPKVGVALAVTAFTKAATGKWPDPQQLLGWLA